MIHYLEMPEAVIMDFPLRDALFTRIAGYARAYGKTAMFWRQGDSALLAKIDGHMTLCAAPDADWAELRAFLDMLGYRSLTLDLTYCAPLQLAPQKQGAIQQFCQARVAPAEIQKVPQADLRAVYDLLQQNGFAGLGDYPDWLADMTLRRRVGVSEVFARYDGAQLSACASLLFQTEGQAFLGAIATVPAYRGRGIGGALVTALAQHCQDAGKQVNLFCADTEIREFYRKIGFQQVGSWAEVEAY